MSANLAYISQRLSLRKPQVESLNILSKFTESIDLTKKNQINDIFNAFKGCGSFEKLIDFERGFPSVAFALATGVGKTRLMGAFISYLYLEKGIRNFLVLAPNLTIYNKLITDFSDSNHSKYVFRGIRINPRIVTGDNYQKTDTVQYRRQTQFGQFSFLDEEVTINIFNISKINAESRSGNAPKIKRVSEYFGESYFEYLKNLDDLVLLMDESHHYRATRGMEVLNDLNPILGLELTATPMNTNGTPFKNIVYEYTLALAINDGYVKEPAAATRKNLSSKDIKAMSDDEIDKMKILDAIRIHEITKINLEKYALNNKKEIIRPFVLVVAQNTDHADQLKRMIQSDDFFGGRYKEKVIDIHSNQAGTEKEENIQKLLDLELPTNKVEIVIHCNMLKEGWDVTNLYTIVPLRSFAANILTEQTLGRGLRLPYGEKTGVKEVDTLTVIAHDRFEELIKKATDKNSIIMKEYFIDPDDEIFKKEQEVVVAQTGIEKTFEDEEKSIKDMQDGPEKEKARGVLNIKKEIHAEAYNSDNVISVDKLSTEEAKEKIKQAIKGKHEQGILITDFEGTEIDKIIDEVYKEIIEEVIRHTIEIPRITIQPKNEVTFGFEDFDLDTKSIHFQPVEEEIFIRYLREQKKTSIHTVINNEIGGETNWVNAIVNELLNYDEVDYDKHGDLLYKLSEQVIEHLKSYLPASKDIDNVVQYYKKQISEYIHTQMMAHFFSEKGEFEAMIEPFTRIEPHNYSKFVNEDISDSRAQVSNKADLQRKVFNYYKKSCHTIYKFDSIPEKEFAAIIDEDPLVLKWLRPHIRQFNIYWCHGSKRYEPDFVVETKEKIFMVEIKARNEIESEEVQEKARAAREYCLIATEYLKDNGGKKWIYIIIPHDEISDSRDMRYFEMCK